MRGRDDDGPRARRQLAHIETKPPNHALLVRGHEEPNLNHFQPLPRIRLRLTTLDFFGDHTLLLRLHPLQISYMGAQLSDWGLPLI